LTSTGDNVHLTQRLYQLLISHARYRTSDESYDNQVMAIVPLFKIL